MHVKVEKTPERPTIIAVRDDGVSLLVRAPDRKFSPPHDLIHFVVEKGMRLQRGFWGSIAGGAKFASMDVIDGRQKPRANERSAQLIKTNQSFLSEAEAIVGAFQTVLHGPASHEDAVWQRLRTGGRKLERSTVSATWAHLVSLREQWQQLPVGDIIRLDWK
jgi:hypothetical protein